MRFISFIVVLRVVTFFFAAEILSNTFYNNIYNPPPIKMIYIISALLLLVCVCVLECELKLKQKGGVVSEHEQE